MSASNDDIYTLNTMNAKAAKVQLGTLISDAESVVAAEIALANGSILMGNGSGIAAAVAVSGDISLSNLGVAAISSGVIVDADVNAAAAIAGSKISPDFGAQNIVTTGSISGGSLVVSAATIPTNGFYLNAANSVATAVSSAYAGNVTGVGVALQWNFGNALTGQFNFSNDGVRPIFIYNSGAVVTALQQPTIFHNGVNTQSLRLSGGFGGTSGAALWLYGGAHATLSNNYQMVVGGVPAYDYVHSTTSHVFTGDLAASKRMAAGTSVNANAQMTVGSTLNAATEIGFYALFNGTPTATTAVKGAVLDVGSNASAITVTNVMSLDAGVAAGAGSTITRASMINLARGFSGAGTITNRSFISDNNTWTGSYFINSTSTFPSLLSGYLMVANQADPGAVEDGIRIGSQDISAGNATLSLRTETAAVASGDVAATHTLSFYHNGSVYKFLLSNV